MFTNVEKQGTLWAVMSKKVSGKAGPELGLEG
jgi:hypothetical protein